jgi:hypothetical protein
VLGGFTRVRDKKLLESFANEIWKWCFREIDVHTLKWLSLCNGCVDPYLNSFAVKQKE